MINEPEIDGSVLKRLKIRSGIIESPIWQISQAEPPFKHFTAMQRMHFPK